jgi:hypothetical protein
MGRLIETGDPQAYPSRLVVRVADVLLFHATGGHVRSGSDAVEVLGALLPAVTGDDGAVYTPAGSPNTVLFRALAPGRARIEVVTGSPFSASRVHEMEVVVEP